MDWQLLISGSVVPVVVALIGAWAVIRKHEEKATKRSDQLREENSQQHAEGRALLTHLSGQVSGMDEKLDRMDERLDDMHVWRITHEIEHEQ